MFDLIIYTVISVFTVMIATIQGSYTVIKNQSKLDEYIMNSSTSFIFITLVSIFLSGYSTYLAMSGKLVDATRYAWSFYNRYPMYYDSFINMFNSDTEISFLILNKIIYEATYNVFWLFFIVAFIVNFSTLYVAKKINYKLTFFIFLYLFSQYYFFTTYALRQALAVSISNIAILYYFRKQYFNYFLFALLAMSFHLTAFILIPLFFIFKIIKKRSSYLLLILIFIISILFFDYIFYNILPSIPVIGENLVEDHYMNSFDIQSYMVVFKGFPFYLVTVIAINRRKDLLNKTKHADLFIVSNLFFSLAWLLSFNFYWLFRMSWYFGVLSLSLVPLLYKTIHKKYERVLFIMIIIIPLCVITLRQILITLN